MGEIKFFNVKTTIIFSIVLIVGMTLSFTIPLATTSGEEISLGTTEQNNPTISGKGRMRKVEVEADVTYTIKVTGYYIPFVADPTYIIVYENYLMLKSKKIDNNGVEVSYQFTAEKNGYVYFQVNTDTICELTVYRGAYGNSDTPVEISELGKLGLHLVPIFVIIPLYFIISWAIYTNAKHLNRSFGDGQFPEAEPYDGSPITIGELKDPKASKEKSIFCWNCGAPNDLDMTFCINCGKELATPDKK